MHFRIFRISHFQEIQDFFSKCDQIRSFLRICSHLLKKSLMENFIFSALSDFSRWLFSQRSSIRDDWWGPKYTFGETL